MESGLFAHVETVETPIVPVRKNAWTLGVDSATLPASARETMARLPQRK